jgi:hypothetical protein
MTLASKTTPLMTAVHAPSASDNSYWPEIYTNIPIATPDPLRRDGGKTFAECGPSDSALFYRIEDYVQAILQHRRIDRYTPAQVQAWFVHIGEHALAALAEADALVTGPNSPEYRATRVDITVQAQLALFFADKLEAATQFGFYRETGDFGSLVRAITAYEQALQHWREIVSITAGVYQPNLAFHRNPIMSGSWADREAAILDDLAQMKMFQHNFLSQYADGALSFVHVPVRSQHAPEIEIETTIKGWERVRAAHLYFRLGDEGTYTAIRLAQDPQCLPRFVARWQVPATTTHIDYYLTASISDGETLIFPQDGTKHPLSLQVGEPAQALRCMHTLPARFVAGEPFTVTCALDDTMPVQDVRLHYRHVNQAELILTQEMTSVTGSYQAVIPADYTNSPYALMYYFSVNDRFGNCFLYPGLESEQDAPYFVITQTMPNPLS